MPAARPPLGSAPSCRAAAGAGSALAPDCAWYSGPRLPQARAVPSLLVCTGLCPAQHREFPAVPFRASKGAQWHGGGHVTVAMLTQLLYRGVAEQSVIISVDRAPVRRAAAEVVSRVRGGVRGHCVPVYLHRPPRAHGPGQSCRGRPELLVSKGPASDWAQAANVRGVLPPTVPGRSVGLVRGWRGVGQSRKPLSLL